MVERDDVSDRTQCDQIKQRGHVRVRTGRFQTAPVQSAPERQHHVKNHAHAGNGLALKEQPC